MRNNRGESSHPGIKPKKTSPKAREDQCSATEQLSHSFTLALCSLVALDGLNDASPVKMH